MLGLVSISSFEILLCQVEFLTKPLAISMQGRAERCRVETIFAQWCLKPGLALCRGDSMRPPPSMGVTGANTYCCHRCRLLCSHHVLQSVTASTVIAGPTVCTHYGHICHRRSLRWIVRYDKARTCPFHVAQSRYQVRVPHQEMHFGIYSRWHSRDLCSAQEARRLENQSPLLRNDGLTKQRYLPELLQRRLVLPMESRRSVASPTGCYFRAIHRAVSSADALQVATSTSFCPRRLLRFTFSCPRSYRCSTCRHRHHCLLSSPSACC